MHLDVELTLRRNLIKAATAGIALHIDDAQTITGILADTLKRSQQARLDLSLQLMGFLAQSLFLHACLIHDLVQFALLHVEVTLFLLKHGSGAIQLHILLLDAALGLTDLLVAEFDLQRLELNFLRQCVILTVVAYVVQLLLVALHQVLRLDDLATLLRDGAIELVYLGLDTLDTRSQTFNLGLQVFYLQRQLTTQGSLLVNRRQGGLQLEEGLQFLLYRQICRIFLCHKCNLQFDYLLY